MARYFFHVSDGLRSTVDSHGVVLRDERAARKLSANALVERAADIVKSEVVLDTISIDVTDESGVALFSAALSLRYK